MALREIERRWRRLCRDASEQVANRFFEAVLDTGATLQNSPGIGTLCQTKSGRFGELRRFPVTLPFGKWLILYRVTGEDIIILRVLHGAQNWQRLFQ